MAAKTWACPACGCLNPLPATDKDGHDAACVSCKFPVHISEQGKLNHPEVTKA
jgi:hypothetical protein